MARAELRRRRRGAPNPLPLTGQEISVMLRALSFFESALRHDPRERHTILQLKRKLHEHLARMG